MTSKNIVFVEKNVAKLLEEEVRMPDSNEILVKTFAEYSGKRGIWSSNVYAFELLIKLSKILKNLLHFL